MRDGAVRLADEPDRAVAFAEIARTCSDRGDNLREEGWYRYPEDRYIYGHTFMAAAADVEVDLGTGDIRLLKLVNLLDMGKVINPTLAAGQQYGATVQGLGLALMESMTTKDGRLQTPTLAEYLIPTATDLPEALILGSIETPYPTGLKGQKASARRRSIALPQHFSTQWPTPSASKSVRCPCFRNTFWRPLARHRMTEEVTRGDAEGRASEARIRCAQAFHRHGHRLPPHIVRPETLSV